MKYQLIIQNYDCPQTYLNITSISTFLKTKNIDVTFEESPYKLVIGCILFDVEIASPLLQIITSTKKEFLMAYGCYDDEFIKDWSPFFSVILKVNDIPEHISCATEYFFTDKTCIIKTNTGCKKKCNFCRRGNKDNLSFTYEQIIYELEKYDSNLPVNLYSSDCSAFEPDQCELLINLINKYPERKFALHSCYIKYFLDKYNIIKNLFEKSNLIGIGVSLQSGSNKILEKMGRSPIDRNIIKNKILELKSILDKNQWIYTEFIYRFPEESKDDLLLSLNLCKVFPYAIWYRYFKVRHTKTAIDYPEIYIGTDYSADIEQFAKNNNIAYTIIPSNGSVFLATKQNKFNWAIKK